MSHTIGTGSDYPTASAVPSLASQLAAKEPAQRQVYSRPIVQPPPSFCLGDCFYRWSSRVQSYLRLFHSSRHAYLISILLSDDAYDRVLNANVELENIGDSTFSALEEVITDCLLPSEYSLKFRYRVLQDGETCEQFVMDLWRLVKQAYPTKSHEKHASMVLGRMLGGMTIAKVNQKFRRDRPQSEHDALRVAIDYEKRKRKPYSVVMRHSSNDKSIETDLFTDIYAYGTKQGRRRRKLSPSKCFYCRQFARAARECGHNEKEGSLSDVQQTQSTSLGQTASYHVVMEEPIGCHHSTEPIIPQPPPFNLGDCFYRWSSRVKRYLRLFHPSRHAYLISILLSDNAYERVLNANIELENDSNSTFSALQEVLTDFLDWHVYWIQRRHRYQQRNENIEWFVQDLRRLERQAGFISSMEEECILQSMLDGMLDKDLASQMRRNLPTSTNEAVDIVMRAERYALTPTQREFNQPSGGMDVNRLQ